MLVPVGRVCSSPRASPHIVESVTDELMVRREIDFHAPSGGQRDAIAWRHRVQKMPGGISSGTLVARTNRVVIEKENDVASDLAGTVRAERERHRLRDRGRLSPSSGPSRMNCSSRISRARPFTFSVSFAVRSATGYPSFVTAMKSTATSSTPLRNVGVCVWPRGERRRGQDHNRKRQPEADGPTGIGEHAA